MAYSSWEEMYYTAEKFEELCASTSCFNDDINRNHRVRDSEVHFSEFMNEGSNNLLRDQPELVATLI